MLQKITSLKTTSALVTSFIPSPTGEIVLEIPPKEDFMAFALDNQRAKSIFPTLDFIVTWKTYTLNEKSVSQLYDKHRVMWSFNPMNSCQEHTIRMISFMHAFKCEAGLRVNFDIYGSDESHFIKHLTNILQCIPKEYPCFEGNVEFVIGSSTDLGEWYKENQMKTQLKWEPGSYHTIEKNLLIQQNLFL